jgi:hypothetical protein
MKKTLITALVAACTVFAGQAFAANAECDKKAEEKKLAGAAKTSFLKKCEKDAGAAPAATAKAASPACEKSAADKKLAGAAKTSHLKKCMADEKAGTAPKS